MHFEAHSKFRKGWVISLQNLHSNLPFFFFDPAENDNVIKYFKIRRQISKFHDLAKRHDPHKSEKLSEI